MTDSVSNSSQTVGSIAEDATREKLIAADAAARRQYAIWATVAGIFFQTSFVLYHWISDHIMESVFDMASVLLIVAILILLKMPRLEIWGYRLIAFVLIGINVYTSLFPSHETISGILGFYVIPVVVFYLLGQREGRKWVGAVWGFLILYMVVSYLFFTESLSLAVILDTQISFLLICTFSFLSEWHRWKSFDTYLNSHEALTDALQQKKALGGLIPICSQCMKIRDDRGFWQNLESFLTIHTSAQVSSSICDACADAGARPPSSPGVEPSDFISRVSAWRSTEAIHLRKYIRHASIAGVFVLAGYIVSGAIQGNFVELAGQLMLGTILLLSALNLQKTRHVKFMHHLIVLTTFLLFANQFWTPSPNSTDYLWLYIVPLTAFLVVGFRMGVFWTFATLLLATMVFTVPYFAQKYQYTMETALFFLTTYILLGFFCGAMEWARRRYSSRIHALLTELHQVYEGIRTLKGLVPVCSHCKSIMNDEGYWTRVDFYLLKHIELSFSHGICPECLKKDMPELYDEMKDQPDLY